MSACMLIPHKGHTDTIQVYSVTVMTHVKALQARHSSQGTSEPITPAVPDLKTELWENPLPAPREASPSPAGSKHNSKSTSSRVAGRTSRGQASSGLETRNNGESSGAGSSSSSSVSVSLQWCDIKLRNSNPFRTHTTDLHQILLGRRRKAGRSNRPTQRQRPNILQPQINRSKRRSTVVHKCTMHV